MTLLLELTCIPVSLDTIMVYLLDKVDWSLWSVPTIVISNCPTSESLGLPVNVLEPESNDNHEGKSDT